MDLIVMKDWNDWKSFLQILNFHHAGAGEKVSLKVQTRMADGVSNVVTSLGADSFEN